MSFFLAFRFVLCVYHWCKLSCIVRYRILTHTHRSPSCHGFSCYVPFVILLFIFSRLDWLSKGNLPDFSVSRSGSFSLFTIGVKYWDWVFKIACVKIGMLCLRCPCPSRPCFCFKAFNWLLTVCFVVLISQVFPDGTSSSVCAVEVAAPGSPGAARGHAFEACPWAALWGAGVAKKRGWGARSPRLQSKALSFFLGAQRPSPPQAKNFRV